MFFHSTHRDDFFFISRNKQQVQSRSGEIGSLINNRVFYDLRPEEGGWEDAVDV